MGHEWFSTVPLARSEWWTCPLFCRYLTLLVCAVSVATDCQAMAYMGGFALRTRHWAVTGNDTESTLSLILSSYRERALGSAVQCRKDIPAGWHWVFGLGFFRVAADKELIYWWLFSYHLHADRQAQTRWRLRHIQPCCLQSPAFPDITRRGLTCTIFPCRSNSQTLLSASAF